MPALGFLSFATTVAEVEIHDRISCKLIAFWLGECCVRLDRDEAD